MEYYLLMNHWSELLRDFKDGEREHGHSTYTVSQLGQTVIQFIRRSRIRQWNLFVQQRGEDFERLVASLEDYDSKLVERFLENSELWKTTLEMGEH
jgi:hypothetical protein